MSDAFRYRALAAEYYQLASTITDPNDRDRHLKLARTWDSFARQAEQRADRTQQIGPKGGQIGTK